ncbi:zinc finger protein 559 [Scaptodrosophila lebanonensis]|uniref:Zinc finger protein 559 n=1 Tax=Drosophila lebanonensis TaxID=7225 RepID=A0A6J2UCB4_DROLE|nr:zinc finger protein 559 [Scaptodrosophila lebanonensis]
MCPSEMTDIIEYAPNATPRAEEEEITETPRIIYVCSLCLRQYDLLEDLRGHMMFYHGYQPITQTKARSNANAAKELKKKSENDSILPEPRFSHVVTVAPAESRPELRPMPFKDFRILLRAHMKLPCSVTTNCAYKLQDSTKLALHAKCHKNTSFSCCECGLDQPNWRRCSAHLWKTHKIDVDLLQCPVCDYKSPVSVLVWRHMRVHKKWRARVLRSLRAVQRRRAENANKVGASGVEPSNVAAPVTTAANKNKYYAEKTCEICNRKFVNGKTLSKHVKTVHNKIKPFICNVCGKKTARKASLIIHMRQHTGEKPLQCEQCKFSTRDPSVLHKHRQRHKPEQDTLKCRECDYTCIQANAFKRHMRQNHAAAYRDMCCDMCSFTSINTATLLAHKEDHRKGLITNCEDSMDATRATNFKYPRKLNDKGNEMSVDCFMPLESIDSLPHEPAVDTGGVTIPAPSEDTQFPTYLSN